MESLMENLVKKYYKFILPDKKVIYNYRPAWLKNKQGNKIELDIYYPDLKFAIEVNGFQHKILKQQIEHDKIKQEICKKMGITLIVITNPKQLIRGKKNRIDRQKRKIPYSLIKRIKHYNPLGGKNSKRFRWIINNKARVENYREICAREIEGNRIRMEFRRGVSPKTKDLSLESENSTTPLKLISY